jgi:predicted nucleic acid-binding protein
MSGDFLDSNVFVYLFDPTDPAKRSVAMSLVNESLSQGNASISFQVVQETLNVITTRIELAATIEEARGFLNRVLMPLCKILPSESLYDHALSLRKRYRYAFYDSLIIAAALEGGCTRLLSEDLQYGQRIEGLTIVDPFRA